MKTFRGPSAVHRNLKSELRVSKGGKQRAPVLSHPFVSGNTKKVSDSKRFGMETIFCF